MGSADKMAVTAGISDEDERVCYKQPRLEETQEISELVLTDSSTMRKVCVTSKHMQACGHNSTRCSFTP